MQPRRARTATTFGSALALASALAGPSSASAPQRLQTELVTEEDGLPSTYVTAIAQTPDGRVWFAARGNVAAWDGHEWQDYQQGVELPDEFHAVNLCADSAGRVWVASERVGAGILRIDADGWELLHLAQGQHSRRSLSRSIAALEGGDGPPRIALATLDTIHFHDVEAGSWSRLDRSERPEDEFIVAVQPLGPELYVATSRGLQHVAAGATRASTMLELSDPEDQLLGVHAETLPSGARRIWVVGRGWFGYLEDGELTRLPMAIPDMLMGYVPPTTLLPDGSGGLFFGSPSTLLHFDAAERSVRLLGIEEGMVSDGVTALLRDLDHNVWATNLRGATRIPPQRFSTWTADHGLQEDEVTAIEPFGDGGLALGHHWGLTLMQDGALRQITLRETDPLERRMGRVLDLQADGEGGLWVAVSFTGVAHIDREGAVRWVAKSSSCSFTSIARRADGRVVLGSTQGLWSLERGVLTPLPETDALGTVRRLFEAADGALHVAVLDRGVLREDGEGWRSLEPENGQSGLEAYDFEQDAGGTIWVGTDDGLYFVHGDRLRRSVDGPSFDAPVYSLLCAADGALWYGTSSGLGRWRDGRTEHFSTADGLAGPEANRDALHEDEQGRVWIGTDGGLSCFLGDPAQEPRPLTLELTVGSGHADPGAGEARFDNGRDLAFRVRAVSFADDRRILYRARLLGYEEDWLPERALEGGELRYTNLPPGEYQLEVQARGRRGDWGPVTRSERLQVVTPIWQRGWFLPALLGGGALLVASLTGLASARRRSRRLELAVRRSTRALAESELRYREMFQKNPAIQLLLEPRSGRVLEANLAAASYFGNSVDELRALTLAQLTGMSQGEFAAGFQRLETSGEWVCRPCEDDPLYGPPIEIRASLFELAGESIVQATIYDIEIRQRLEQQLLEASKLRAVGELASGVAHDFNNLLTAILGHNELLAMEARGDERTAQHADNIRQAGERGAKLVQQLLTFGRKQRLRFEEFELNPIIRNTTGILQSVLGARTRVELDLEEAVGRIRADRSQIERVLMNLTLNARDAMPGGGTLTLQTRRVPRASVEQLGELLDPQRDYVRLSIRDDGVGMTAEEREQMFEPFFTTKQLGKGTGLGLSLVRNIVVESQGATSVESTPGEGTTIHIYLPALDQQPRSALPSETSGGRVQQQGDLTVLLVEDDDAVRATIAALLAGSGQRVLQARSAADARRVFAEHATEIDVVLSDLNLPDENGRLLAAALRERRPGLQVLFMSGLYDEALAEQREVFIQKPFSLDKLQQALSGLLSA